MSTLLRFNQQQIIQGQHATNTTIAYNSNTTRLSWFNCNTEHCYFTLANATMLFEFLTSVQPKFVIYGGTMQFVNVIFDGINQTIVFKGRSDDSEVIFINCTFVNNNAKYRFETITAKFINSTFSGNTITSLLNLTLDEDGLIIVDSSTVHITGCLFENSHIIRRPLLTVYYGSLVVENSEFRNITGYVNHTNPGLFNVYVLFYINAASPSNVDIIGSTFIHITDFSGIINVDDASFMSCRVRIENSIFKNNDNSFEYIGNKRAHLILSNCMFLNSTAKISIFLYGTKNTTISNTVWDGYYFNGDEVNAKIAQSQHGDVYTLINNITIRNSDGGCIYVLKSSSTISIINSVFEGNTVSAEYGCVVLFDQQEYIIRHNRFENNKGGGTALIVERPTGYSVFESLSFINNHADYWMSPADFVIHNNAYVNSKITINGSWYISGSYAEESFASSCWILFEPQDSIFHNTATSWSIDMVNWTIQNTSAAYYTIPAITLYGVNFNMINSSVTDNKYGVFVFQSTYKSTIKIQDSYFAGNVYPILSQLKIFNTSKSELILQTLWPTSDILLIGNDFDSNIGAILEISTYNGTITSIAKNQSICTDVICDDNKSIKAFRIGSMINGTVDGSVFSCSSSLDDCLWININVSYNQTMFIHVDNNITDMTFHSIYSPISSHHISQTNDTIFVNVGTDQPLVSWEISNNETCGILQWCSSYGVTRFIMNGVNVKIRECHVTDQINSSVTNNVMFEIVNNARVRLINSEFSNNARSLIRVNQSVLNIDNCVFFNNSGLQLNYSCPIIATISSELNIFDSIFEANHDFPFTIHSNGYHQFTTIMNTTFSNGMNNYFDYFDIGTSGLHISNCSFINGIVNQYSLQIHDVHQININNVQYSGYKAAYLISVSGNNTTEAMFNNLNIENITGGCLLTKVTNLSVLSSIFKTIINGDAGGAMMVTGETMNINIHNTLFEQCHSSLYGGALFVNQSLNEEININITNCTFTDNTALDGSAVHSSSNSWIMVSEPTAINVSISHPRIIQQIVVQNPIVNVEQLYIYLLPKDKESGHLQWSKLFRWNNTNIHLSDDLKVDTEAYSSSLIISMKTLNDSIYTIPQGFVFYLDINFNDFLSVLTYSSQLKFDIYLFALETHINLRSNSNSVWTLKDNVFCNNKASALSTLMWTVNGQQNTHIFMNNNTFINNTACGLSSVGIMSYGAVSNLSIEATKNDFYNNIAQTSVAGMGILATNALISLHENTFSSNQVQENSAVMLIDSAAISLSSSVIRDNHSPLGGNILCNKCKLMTIDSFFLNNIAHVEGASVLQVHNIDNSNITITNCSFSNNNGITGSCLMFHNANMTTISTAAKQRHLLSSTTFNDLSDQCNGIAVSVNEDFHSEDIEMYMIFDDDKNTKLKLKPRNSCTANVSPSINCISFSIYDTFGDGLSYGEGNYIVSWKGHKRESASWGDYGTYESLQICPSKAGIPVETVFIWVSLGDENSYNYINFWDKKLLTAFDGVLEMRLVFSTYSAQYDAIDASDCDCILGYCLCNDLLSNNVTMENVVSALCYQNKPTIHQKFNYTYQDMWSNNIRLDNKTIEEECFLDLTLEANYDMMKGMQIMLEYSSLQPSDERYLWNKKPSHLDEIKNIMTEAQSYCDLYLMAFDIIDPICKTLVSNYSVNPTLCQANKCHSTYCNSNETYLSVISDHASPKIWNHNHFSGAKMFKIRYTKSILVGKYEYFNRTCYNGDNMDLVTINNTIPILFVHIGVCNYNNVIQLFQKYGARAVILAVNSSKKIQKDDSYANIYIPIETVHVQDALTITDVQQFHLGLLCDTKPPTPAPTANPTKNPSISPSRNPTKMPTVDPTIMPTPNPVNVHSSNDTFIMFTYQGLSYQQHARFKSGITYPRLTEGQFLQVYQHNCLLSVENINIDFANDNFVYSITADNFVEEFDNICVQFDDASNRVVTNWNLFEYQNRIQLQSIAETSTSNGCFSNVNGSRVSLPIQEKGKYCFVIWTNEYLEEKQYNIIIKSIATLPSFPTVIIEDTTFYNNVNEKGTGGTIGIESETINNSISIVIQGSTFFNNSASAGGGTIFWDLSHAVLNSDTMNILFLYNTTIHGDQPVLLKSTEQPILQNIVWIENTTIQSVTGTNVKSDGMILYIKDSKLTGGNDIHGGCLSIYMTALTIYNSTVESCTAQYGAGLYNYRASTATTPYDTPISIYDSKFSNNHATKDGAGMYLQLNGERFINHHISSKEDCVRLYNVLFIDNHADNGRDNTIYISLSGGDHDLLKNSTPLSHICSSSQCLIGTNTLRDICTSTNKTKCLNCDNTLNHSIINIHAANTGLYICGRDSFNHPLDTENYVVNITSGQAEVSKTLDHKQYYYDQLKINDGFSNATACTFDSNQIASSICNTFKIVPNTHSVIQIWLISLLSVIIFFCALVFIWIMLLCYQYHNAHIVSKVLVLIISINEFDDETQKLPDDVAISEKLKTLWRNTYKYDVVQCGAYCTQQALITFIDDQMKKVQSNDLLYEGVIVHILTHSDESHQLLTSDGTYLPFDFIKHELSCAAENVDNLDLMKVIFFHACRGRNNYYNNSSKPSDIETKYKTKNKIKCICNWSTCCKKNENIASLRVPLIKNQKEDVPLHNIKINGKLIQSPSVSSSRGIGGLISNKKSKTAPADANFVTIFGNYEGRTVSTAGHFADCICELFEDNANRCPCMSKNFLQLIAGDDRLCMNDDGLCVKMVKITGDAQICDSNGFSTMTFPNTRFDIWKRKINEMSDHSDERESFIL
eukprot:461788_1